MSLKCKSSFSERIVRFHTTIKAFSVVSRSSQLLNQECAAYDGRKIFVSESPLMFRNQFPGIGNWHIPIVPKVRFTDEKFKGLRLIDYDRTKSDDEQHLERIVHFPLYDYKFECVGKRPD